MVQIFTMLKDFRERVTEKKGKELMLRSICWGDGEQGSYLEQETKARWGNW